MPGTVTFGLPAKLGDICNGVSVKELFSSESRTFTFNGMRHGDSFELQGSTTEQGNYVKLHYVSSQYVHCYSFTLKPESSNFYRVRRTGVSGDSGTGRTLTVAGKTAHMDFVHEKLGPWEMRGVYWSRSWLADKRIAGAISSHASDFSWGVVASDNNLTGTGEHGIAATLEAAKIAVDTALEKLCNPLTTEKNKDIDMTEKTEGTFAMNLVEEAKSGGWQAVAEEAAKRTRDVFVDQLKKAKVGTAVHTGVKTFLNTEIGLGVWSFGLGMILPYVPKAQNSPEVMRVGKELRTGGFRHGGLAVMDKLVDTVMSIVDTVTLTESMTRELGIGMSSKGFASTPATNGHAAHNNGIHATVK